MARFEYETKVWGKVAHVFVSPQAAVSHLILNAGFRCSLHSHKYRVNQFSILSGRVVVEQRNSALSRTLSVLTALDPGESVVVPAGVVHRFVVIESGEMIEVYWPSQGNRPVSLDDIERLDEGGSTGNLS